MIRSISALNSANVPILYLLSIPVKSLLYSRRIAIAARGRFMIRL